MTLHFQPITHANSQKISHFTGIELDEEYLEVAKRRLDPPVEADLFG